MAQRLELSEADKHLVHEQLGIRIEHLQKEMMEAAGDGKSADVLKLADKAERLKKINQGWRYQRGDPEK